MPKIDFPPDVDWRCWIERWDRMQDYYLPRREERFELMVRTVADTQATVSRVLDLGCGTGSLMLKLLEKLPGSIVYGIDFDPTLLVLAEKRLANFGERAKLIQADLRNDSWPKLAPDIVDAVVSATALHWLSSPQLERLYTQLAGILRPGGIFLNADHVRSRCEILQRAWQEHREQMRARHKDPDDWDGFWDAYGQALNVDIKELRRELEEPWEGSEEGLPLDWHFESLKASGFEAVDCFWRLDGDAIYGGIRSPG
ncbi:MAG: class I SAM-dependent methyltransferase [Planctomycetota bacterium]